MDVFLKFLFNLSRDELQIHIARDLEVDKNTISRWAILIREIIQSSLIENRETLGGYDEDGRSKIVEIDESISFKRKYNRGRVREAKRIFGLIEKDTRKCEFSPVENRSAETLLPIIYSVRIPGTTIISDGWAAYRNISRRKGYTHLSVNHSINFADPEDPSVHTRNIENSWLHLKRSLRKQFGCKQTYMDGYLYEHMFKKSSKPLVLSKLFLLLKKAFN